MPILFGLALLAVTAAFVWHVAQDMKTTSTARRVTSSRAGQTLRHAGHAAASSPAGQRAGEAIRSGGRRYRNGRQPVTSLYRRAVVVGGERARAFFPETFDDPPSDGHPHDELAPRREQKNAPRQDDSPPSGSASHPAGAPPSSQQPEPSGGNQSPMSHTSNGSGSSADLFSAMQQVISQARAGGLQAKARAIKTFAEAHDYMAQTMQQFAQEMAEPDQGYPQSIWEPLQQVSQHDRAAASKATEADSAMTALANMQVGELAASSTRAPHQSELNSDTASR